MRSEIGRVSFARLGGSGYLKSGPKLNVTWRDTAGRVCLAHGSRGSTWKPVQWSHWLRLTLRGSGEGGGPTFAFL